MISDLMLLVAGIISIGIIVWIISTIWFHAKLEYHRKVINELKQEKD